MPVTPDVDTDGLANAALSLTFAHTCAPGATLIVVGVGHSSSVALRTVSSVTYDGVALTKKTPVASNGFIGAEFWFLKNPATAAPKNVVVTMSAACDISANASSYFGTNALFPLGTPVAGSGAVDSSLVVAGANASDLVIDCVARNAGGAAAAGVGQTELCNQATATVGQILRHGVSTKIGAASVTMAWTLGDVWAGVAVRLPAQGVSTGSRFNRLGPR